MCSIFLVLAKLTQNESFVNPSFWCIAPHDTDLDVTGMRETHGGDGRVETLPPPQQSLVRHRNCHLRGDHGEEENARLPGVCVCVCVARVWCVCVEKVSLSGSVDLNLVGPYAIGKRHETQPDKHRNSEEESK